MKKFKILFWAVSFIGVTLATASSFNYERYKSGTMSSVINEISPDIQAHLRETPRRRSGTDLSISASSISIKTTCTYTGEYRKITKNNLQLLKAWANSINNAAATSAFKHEVKLEEEGKTFWVPIQEVLIEPLKKEVKTGAVADFFVVYIGAVAPISKGKFKTPSFLFIINEFNAPKTMSEAKLQLPRHTSLHTSTDI